MKSQFFPNSRLLWGCRQSGSGVALGGVSCAEVLENSNEAFGRSKEVPGRFQELGRRRRRFQKKLWESGWGPNCPVNPVPNALTVRAGGTRRLVCQAISVHQNAGKRHVIFHKLRGFRSAADSKLEALPRISVFFPGDVVCWLLSISWIMICVPYSAREKIRTLCRKGRIC